jgi:hypothetical protein
MPRTVITNAEHVAQDLNGRRITLAEARHGARRRDGPKQQRPPTTSHRVLRLAKLGSEAAARGEAD